MSPTAFAIAEYRAATGNSKPIGNKKLCSKCHQPRQQMGGRSFARVNSRHRDWICAGCMEGEK